MAAVFIGIDAGSSVMKAAAYDRDGRMRAATSEPTPLERRAGGRVEADPDRVWSALCAVIRHVTDRLADDTEIAAVGLTGAMVGAWVVDPTGEALRPGINWEDARAQPLIEEMSRDRPGLLSEIFAVSGSVMQQGCTLPVTAALLREDPAVLSRAAAVIGLKDWLRAKLTGVIATDRSEAAVAPGDARTQDRSEALISLFGLDRQRGLFPDPLEATEIAGRVTAAAARATGLPEGVPVATGAGDVIANVVGAGGLKNGAVTGLLGTTCILGVCRDEPSFEPADLGLLFSLPDRHWFRAMVNVAGTLNLDWALDVLYPDIGQKPDRYAAAEALAADVAPGAEGISFLPYLSESGIIAPVADARARAQFAGLAPRHGRAALLRAVYEGVAFSIADLCDLLAPPPDAAIVLTGGGGRSALWRQAIAEVTGRRVVVPRGGEFGARGAALMAAVAVGAVRSLSDGFGDTTDAKVTDPRGDNARAWAAARARFAEVRDRALAR